MTQDQPLSFLPLLVKLFEAGHQLDKSSARAALQCNEQVAQRLLTHLHVERYTYVIRWIRSKGAPTPIYAWGWDMPDAPRPPALTATEKSLARRTDPDRLAKEAENARARRMNAKRATP